jgi:hypothetical protein
MAEYDDFREIAHCGGRIVFRIERLEDGRRTYSISVHHDRPTPAAIIGIYALAPEGIPVGDFRIGGIGQIADPPPSETAMAVFLGSDSRTCWGHECGECGGYFRNGQHPAIYPLTCPYCAVRADAYRFLSTAQKRYVKHYIEMLFDGLQVEMAPGAVHEIVIDMDAIVDQHSGEERPAFYYAAEGQQTRYECDHCGDFNDIRGRYGYCASCGWRNNVQLLKAGLEALRERLNADAISPEEALRACISEFDSCCRDIAAQLGRRVPMKQPRRDALTRALFHNVDAPIFAQLKETLDIDLLQGLASDLPFVRKMLQRRHLFEHNGGVVSRRYLDESGDATASEGVLLRETRENVHRLIGILNRIAANSDRDFHELFPPTSKPIAMFEPQRKRAQQAKS